MIVIDVCLSDIPQSARTTAKNGKVYTKIVVDDRKEPDTYGNTHTVYMNQTKEDREAKEKKTYVGNGKEFKFNGGGNNASTKKPDPTNDLGF